MVKEINVYIWIPANLVPAKFGRYELLGVATWLDKPEGIKKTIKRNNRELTGSYDGYGNGYTCQSAEREYLYQFVIESERGTERELTRG